jgi:hypothetical protein
MSDGNHVRIILETAAGRAATLGMGAGQDTTTNVHAALEVSGSGGCHALNYPIGSLAGI